ncbi:Putative transcriptional regulator, PucR family OS=Tsukamurella paurometabola (strain ATCC 8368 /DSM / CCUG 35730 / CIP 100753 / JCM 10117 / KCTC 9821/ NBRC 16120 / NCIMB 702349 / NCTC 13040) OX=521096 GN=Tpau_2857 PE=3 SV=1 [Tsukamurella paurometabola]|uniref:Putative transcriptional regulator, PucR family n=1 Tax=Tsukamurella paurometabola (strain ATCC 8368 / DSM 20162 / CCUG 35730 / CIP 100753 / JCM 10117 / KCTC 9821 / NBRC 16120 / NCIMB 702349 / NCTC 13040) TaxID=521096 RepID=D5UTH0_TSUPD|nr:helix-turn-helix domain-containing protein [Tsukamurella paurometabola]ADG79455.1 putative transcriptional regulator, PucR family [Tsukamurella paurometabola DSM 20162]SUP35826.1 Sugar diacid utilization regulator [Tsukamurella paurometabola]
MRQTSGNEELGVDPIGAVVAGVLRELEPRLVADRMTALMLAEIPELRADHALDMALAASVAGNVDTVLHGMMLGVEPGRIEAPLAAMEYPRRLAQRGLPVTALVRAYRLGQASMVRQMHDAVRATGLTVEQKLAAHEWITDWSFAYSDTVIETVITAYQRERDRWMQARSGARVARVRELLAHDGVVDADAASLAIGYPLRRSHLALIASYSDSDDTDGPDRVEVFVRELAAAVGPVEAPLLLAADQRTVWGWLPVGDPVEAVDRARRHAAASSGDGPRVAFGAVRPGIEGFRRSHTEAAAARRTAGERPVVFAGDPGVMVAALVGTDPGAAQRWARDVLGPLAEDTEADARLRRTLAVYLRHGGGYKAAAAELTLHPNSVKYRVQRALERRGRGIGADRLDVEVALLVCDPAVSGGTAGH